VLALLAALALQVATGLVADDEIATVGPLNALVPEDWASWGTRWHKGPGQTLLLVLVGLHVAAILFHRLVKRHDLVRPMLTGDQALPATPPSRDNALPPGGPGCCCARPGRCGCPAWAAEPWRHAAARLSVPRLRPMAMDTPRFSCCPRRRSGPGPGPGHLHRIRPDPGRGPGVPGFRGRAGRPARRLRPPHGLLLLAYVDGELAGCGAFRPLADVDYANACEMKRLFVRRAFRRFGLGRLLAQALMDQATQAGYSAMLLDTLDDMEAARGLYASLGFEEIPPYYFNPCPAPTT
jgi:GNAT superfamily N-acetyltransferase